MSTSQCLSRLASGMSLILLLSSSAFAAGLSGSVGSAAEPTMVGISGNCQKAGSSISVTVVTDASGKFSCPVNRLDAGKYTLSSRAVGYVLEGPKEVTLDMGRNLK